ncbi:thymidylate synthase [Agrobacterium phage OLIVR2]|uniref:Thymidylate synthase n=1 Tax=Agrobacterium phage OLIVR1 TaxID=2723769 RepID=A0A858MR91_9CAUD|nr:thymidylate synthase [Xanthomonas campestris]YP_010107131.1 thymidylate synthase [Agrobacterium phage OLIVR1]QIW87399.1 thymidylate synthase [Agrobacterium phage OLIVR2]QIW87506.1 thymidylate synthase [Agrobacterium phage OLIVR3]MCF8861597.1 thymidylate synthase [Xanthomonas campestris pv. campestris]QIW87292.1 thymidylate synthase [Agrobacterium phage OLIVR1]
MNSVDTQYLEVLGELLNSNERVEGRNGGVATHFGKQLRFDDVGNYFPLLTTKRVHFKSILVELLWFLKGHTNIKYLKDHGVSIWDEWADENGELGPVYGAQWRSWPSGRYQYDPVEEAENRIGFVKRKHTIDQITNVINSIKEQPYGRRHIVSAWNPAEVDDMALPPCHTLFQFHVRATGELDVQLYQRSADWFLGVPFNIASYALLLILIAREVGRKPGALVHTFGNYHLYDNHREQAGIQLSREPKELPRIKVWADPARGIFDLEPADIELIGCQSHDSIKAPVSK